MKICLLKIGDTLKKVPTVRYLGIRRVNKWGHG